MTRPSLSPSLIRIYVVSLGIAAFIPALLISTTALLSVQAHVRSEISTSARSLNRAVAQETIRFLNNSLAHLHAYVELINQGIPVSELYTAMHVSTTALSEVSRAFLLDDVSRVTFVSPADQGILGDDFSGMAVLETLKNYETATFSKAFLSLSDGTVAVSIAELSSTNEIVVLELNLRILSEFLEPLRIDPLDHIAILDETGRFIAHTDMAFVFEQRYETRFPLDVDTTSSFKESGVLWYASSEAIPGTSWRVAYYRNATKAFAVLPSMLGLVGIVTFACLGISALIGIRLWKRTTTIFKSYIQQVGAVADGRYDLKVPSTYEEFSALSASIETMATAVANRETELRRTVAERESLLKEVHHRVKNNLQIVVSLLNLEMNTLTDPETASAFGISIDRIRSMGLIHETLYGQDRLDSIELNEYSRRLISELTRAYGTCRVVLNKNDEQILVSLNQAMPCGLILNELITNALKYAVAGRCDAEIIVELCKSADTITVSVTDDGPGLKPGFEPADSSGLGLQLIRTLAEQLGGTASFESRQDKAGLRARLEFHADPSIIRPESNPA